MQGVRRRLLHRTAKEGGLLYVAELHGNSIQPKMDHLVCFLPGVPLSRALSVSLLHTLSNGFDILRGLISVYSVLDLVKQHSRHSIHSITWCNSELWYPGAVKVVIKV